jgi:hypothetical protein
LFFPETQKKRRGRPKPDAKLPDVLLGGILFFPETQTKRRGGPKPDAHFCSMS